MKKILSSVFLLTLLSNCVYTKNIVISDINSEKLNNKTITTVFRGKSDMALKTPFHAAMVGGFLVHWNMVSQGNKIVKENNIEDPAFIIAKKLKDSLAKNYKLEAISRNNQKEVDSYNVNKISSSYRGLVDYVIDVRNLNWGLSYVSGDISNYAITYSSEFKLIDVKNKMVVAENSCTYTPYKKYPKNTILENDAKILKQEFLGAANACAKMFIESNLKLR